MKKKRYLRKSIEETISMITCVLAAVVLMLGNIMFEILPVYLLMVLIEILNIVILEKYGKGEMFEND